MSFYGLSGLQYYLSAQCCSLGLALESDQHRMILLPPALRVHLIDQCPIGLPRHRTCARPTGIDSHVCPMKIIASSARCSTTRLAGQRSLLVAVIRHRRDSHKVDPRWQDAFSRRTRTGVHTPLSGSHRRWLSPPPPKCFKRIHTTPTLSGVLENWTKTT